jgi:hypothetical protein
VVSVDFIAVKPVYPHFEEEVVCTSHRSPQQFFGSAAKFFSFRNNSKFLEGEVLCVEN